MKKLVAFLAGVVVTAIFFVVLLYLGEETKLDIYNISYFHTFLELFFVYTFSVVIIELVANEGENKAMEILIDLVFAGVVCYVFLRTKDKYWMMQSKYRGFSDRLHDLIIPTVVICLFSAFASTPIAENIKNVKK